MPYDELRDKYQKKNFTYRMPFSKIVLLLLFCLGVYLLVSNAYQVYRVVTSKTTSTGYSVPIPQKKAWIFAKHNQHLTLVMRILSQAGYIITTAKVPPKEWHVLWAHDFPFRKEFREIMMNLKPYQKVNKLPGTSSITLKVELARTKNKWIPQAYSIPDEKTQFLAKAERDPKKLWVQKSNNHRGIKIVSSKDVDVGAKSTFVQEFVNNPLLIDKKKFDIGIYVVYTSVNPLQVYVFQDEFLVRFCTEDYYPLDPARRGKYVVGDDYIPLHKIGPLSSRYNQGRMTFKNALFTYLREQGYNTDEIWKDIHRCISEIFKVKAKEMDEDFVGYHSKLNFFELVRVDFVLDKPGRIWLMEVNMSPNLSPDSHPANKLMYMKVIKNALSIGGALSAMDDRFDEEMKDVHSYERDIVIDDLICLSSQCINACGDKNCLVCNQCLNDDIKTYIKKAYREHHHKGPFRRILPPPLDHQKGEPKDGFTEAFGEKNQILGAWFRVKCMKDASWCQ